MNCLKCGAVNPDGSTFCRACGASLEASSPSTASPSLGASQHGGTMVQMTAAFTNAIALLQNPVGYMTQNRDLTVPLNSLMINYVAILALIPLVGRLIADFLDMSGSGGVGYAIAGSVIAYILDLVIVFVIGIVIWKLAASFKTSTNQAKATLLSAYVFTPVFFIGILSIVPILAYRSLLGLLYGLYILYRGLPILLNTSADKTGIYVVATFVVSVVILAVISLVITGLDVAALR